MSSPYGYGWEKFHQATLTMVGAGTQQSRLAAAVLILIRLNPTQDVPPVIRNDFELFIKQMTAGKPAGDEGSVQATANTLDEAAAHTAAEKIVSFYDTVCRSYTEDRIKKSA